VFSPSAPSSGIDLGAITSSPMEDVSLCIAEEYLDFGSSDNIPPDDLVLQDHIANPPLSFSPPSFAVPVSSSPVKLNGLLKEALVVKKEPVVVKRKVVADGPPPVENFSPLDEKMMHPPAFPCNSAFLGNTTYTGIPAYNGIPLYTGYPNYPVIPNYSVPSYTVNPTQYYPNGYPSLPQNEVSPKSLKRSLPDATTDSLSPKKTKKTVISNKRGKKHSNITIEEELSKALEHPDYSGVKQFFYPNRNGQEGLGRVVAIDEEKFYHYILASRPEEYRLDKASLLEKFDKSRPCNRVDPKEKTGSIRIKYIRIDNRKKNPEGVKRDIAEIKSKYPKHKIRIITHRDWNYLGVDEFIYEVKEKRNM